MKLTVLPLTPERWPDLEQVFQARGCSIARGCWCMFYRLSGQQNAPSETASPAQKNRQRLKALVDSGHPPGLIGYRGSVPVGWVSLAPREEFAKLARSPVMKPVDDQPVWSVVCFVVPSACRAQGVATALLEGAVAYAARNGARLVEAYPVDKPQRSHDDFMWFGAKSMFDKAGFVEVARRKPQRPVVRLAVEPAASTVVRPVDATIPTLTKGPGAAARTGRGRREAAAAGRPKGTAIEDVRKLALALPDTTEEPHHSLGSFRVRGRIFLTFPRSGEHLHVFLPDDERELALAMDPSFLEPLHWGKQVPGVRVTLALAPARAVAELIGKAYRHQAAKPHLKRQPLPMAQAKPASAKPGREA